MLTFNVMLNGELIDMMPYDEVAPDLTATELEDYLIKHENYDKNIIVTLVDFDRAEKKEDSIIKIALMYLIANIDDYNDAMQETGLEPLEVKDVQFIYDNV